MRFAVAVEQPNKIERLIQKAGLPQSGAVLFEPQIELNALGKPMIKKATVTYGPKKGKKGY